MSTSIKAMGAMEWFLLIVLSILWGGSFFFGKVALSALPPFTLVFGRVAIAAVALNFMVILSGHRMPLSPKKWASFLMMGLLNNLIPFSLIFWGANPNFQLISIYSECHDSDMDGFTGSFSH